MLSVPPVTSSLEWMPLLGKSSSWGSQLERPQKVVGFFEVGSDGMDFIDQIFEGSDSVLSETILNESIVGEGDSLSVDFTITSLVHEFLDGFTRGITTINKSNTRR